MSGPLNFEEPQLYYTINKLIAAFCLKTKIQMKIREIIHKVKKALKLKKFYDNILLAFQNIHKY